LLLSGFSALITRRLLRFGLASDIGIMTPMKIFVIHYKKLVERKVIMSSQLKANGMEAEFVEQYERGNLREEDLGIFDRRKKFGFFGPSLPKVQMAITLSHLYACQQIAKGHPFGLILEDDARFDDKLGANIAECMAQLPETWDMLFIGDGSKLHIPASEISPGKKVYLKSREATSWGGDGATRCADSYLISGTCAAKLVEFARRDDRRIALPVDWWLNQAIRELGLNVYWAEPTFVTQGTQSGLYDTSY
jgi:GR25 family glycosyltransferase involved in LPS biosynthesis